MANGQRRGPRGRGLWRPGRVAAQPWPARERERLLREGIRRRGVESGRPGAAAAGGRHAQGAREGVAGRGGPRGLRVDREAVEVGGAGAAVEEGAPEAGAAGGALGQPAAAAPGGAAEPGGHRFGGAVQEVGPMGGEDRRHRRRHAATRAAGRPSTRHSPSSPCSRRRRSRRSGEGGAGGGAAAAGGGASPVARRRRPVGVAGRGRCAASAPRCRPPTRSAAARPWPRQGARRPAEAAGRLTGDRVRLSATGAPFRSYVQAFYPSLVPLSTEKRGRSALGRSVPGSARVALVLPGRWHRREPGQAAEGPAFARRAQAGGRVVEATRHDLRRRVRQMEQARAAGRAEAAAGMGMERAGDGEGRARPLGVPQEGGAGRLAAVETMADADPARLAAQALVIGMRSDADQTAWA